MANKLITKFDETVLWIIEGLAVVTLFLWLAMGLLTPYIAWHFIMKWW